MHVFRFLASLIRRRLYTLAAIAILGGMAASGVMRKTSEWLDVYVASGRALLDGKDLMAVRGNTYPPFCALFHVPFAAAPLFLGRLVWVGISVVSLVYLVRTAWRLSGGAKLEGDPPARIDEHLIFLLGLAVSVQFILNVFTHLQTDLLIAALLIAGCAAIANRRYLTAAAWIGLSAAFKATPLLFAPYLLWKRKWFAAFCLVAVAVGVNLLPDLVHRPPHGGLWVVGWFDRYVEPMSQSDYAPGDWRNQLVNNQSIAGAVRRWFATRLQRHGDRLIVIERPDLMDPSSQRKLLLVFSIAILLPVLYAGPRQGRVGPRASELPPSDAGAGRPDPQMIQCGVVMLLMLLLSPNSSRAHFCIMLLPAFCVARFAMRTGNKAAWSLLALALLSSTLSIHLRLARSFAVEQFMLWLGVVMFSAVFLLAASVIALLAGRTSQAPYGAAVAGTSKTASIPDGTSPPQDGDLPSLAMRTAAPPSL